MEAKITGGLEHPGIVPVYGLGAYPDGRPFYAMRFIKGDSLQGAIADFHKPESAGRPWRERMLALRQLLGRLTTDFGNPLSLLSGRPCRPRWPARAVARRDAAAASPGRVASPTIPGKWEGSRCPPDVTEACPTGRI